MVMDLSLQQGSILRLRGAAKLAGSEQVVMILHYRPFIVTVHSQFILIGLMLDPYRACLWTRGPVAISCSWSDDRMNPKPHNLARACTNMSTNLDIADPVITIGDSDSEASKTVSTLFRCCSACREPSMSC